MKMVLIEDGLLDLRQETAWSRLDALVRGRGQLVTAY